LIADLSAFQAANPVADPPADFEPDGTWYSMVVVRGDFYAVDPNHGEVEIITPGGQITRLVDFTETVGHIVPTAITYKGNFFVGNLGTFPVVPGTEQVRKLNPSGNHRTWVTGLTTVLGLAFDGRDRLYVLESLTNPGFPGPGQVNSGRVIRIDPSGVKTVIATGLNSPGGMTFGPDGALYVSNFSFGFPPGAGQVVKIEVPTKGSKNQIQSEVTSQPSLPDTKPAITKQPAPEPRPEPATTRQQSSVFVSVTANDDLNLQQVVANSLSEDPELSSVSVAVNDGRAVLSGTVSSAASKAKAERLVKALRGVNSIENRIKVSTR
jgi:hypothetical protein